MKTASAIPSRLPSAARLRRLAGVCACALWLIAPPASAQSQARKPVVPQEIDRIIAVVNDEVITKREFEAKLAQVRHQLQRQKVQLPDADVLNRQLLERLVLERAQLQLARDSSIRVDDMMLERALTNIAASNKLTMTEFRDALARDGITWSRFRQDVRNEIILSRLREREVDSRLVITDGEIDNFLSNEMTGGQEEFTLAHILLRVPEQASPEQLARLQAKAEKIIALARTGEDFGKLAASFSDAQDAMNGGMIGTRPLDRLPTLFAEAVAPLKPGDMTPVLRSSAGLHIVKVLDRQGETAAMPVKVVQTRARHILIKTSEVVSDAEARRKLVNLHERIRLGNADFVELAKVHSQDLSAAKGGDLGWLYPGDTVPEFEKAMNALQPGQVSEPIQSPFGWHLIQVVERRDQDVSEERKRMAARNALRERKSDEAFQDWVRQLRDRTYVEYRLEDR